MEKLAHLIGKTFAESSAEIDAFSTSAGCQTLPWPEGIGLVSEDPGTIIVYINNDIDDIITGFKFVAL
jgi:hypothetical protein